MGLFGSAGLKSAFSVAALTAQDIVAKSISLTQTAGNIAVQLVTGAKLKLGGGTTDFLTSDGATKITAAGDFTVTGASILTQGATVGNNTGIGAATINKIIFSSGSGTITATANNPATGLAAFNVDSSGALSGTDKILSLKNNGTELLFADLNGRIANTTPGNSTGSPGNAVLNTASGRSAIAATAAAVTITNSLVSATSIVFVVIQTADATLTFIKSVVPGAGSFVVTGNAAATATTNIGWLVFNL